MDFSSKPFSLPRDQRLVDEIDLGDLISEREHEMSLSPAGQGHLTMKLLADPNDPQRDLWDAGRLASPPLALEFRLKTLEAERPVTLYFRVAPEQPAKFDVSVDGSRVGRVALEPSDSWREVPLHIGPVDRASPLTVRLTSTEGGFALYHVWVTQPR
jgi:hypothetical protein